MKALRIPDGQRISNARVKPKGDISGERVVSDHTFAFDTLRGSDQVAALNLLQDHSNVTIVRDPSTYGQTQESSNFRRFPLV